MAKKISNDGKEKPKPQFFLPSCCQLPMLINIDADFHFFRTFLNYTAVDGYKLKKDGPS
ncbi:hypothetical protein AAZX31_18G017600 [Glycine max]